MPLGAKDTQVAILHEQWRVVDRQDPLVAEAEQRRPAIMAMTP